VKKKRSLALSADVLRLLEQRKEDTGKSVSQIADVLLAFGLATPHVVTDVRVLCPKCGHREHIASLNVLHGWHCSECRMALIGPEALKEVP